jgi:hypothetical protein
MSLVTPNMFLTQPTVGDTTGGTSSSDYGPILNEDLSIIDTHNHTPGQGVQIPPSGLNINTNLSLQNNSLVNVNSIEYLGAVLGTPTILSTYTNGTDLFYKDVSGNSIQLTKAGGPNAGTGNIQNLPSTPIGGAGISWVNSTSTFQFLLDAGTVGANIESGSIVLRYPGSYPTPTGNFVALHVSSSLTSGYNLTFPAALPSVLSFVQMDTGGNLSNLTTVGGITGSNIQSNVALAGNVTIGTSLTIGATTPITISGANLVIPGFNLGSSSNSILTTTGPNQLLVGNATGSSLRSAILFQPTNAISGATNTFAALFGTINSGGATIAGIGFSCTRTGVGLYTISFDQAFSQLPAVSACSASALASPGLVSVTSIGTTSFNISVETYNNLSNAYTQIDSAISFVVMGQIT